MNNTCKLLALWLGLAVISPAAAVQNSWTGAGGDMLWTNSANWSLGVLPDSTQDVFIGDTGTNAVILNAPAQAATFGLASNALFTLAGDLSVQTTVAIEGAMEWTAGDYTANGWTTVGANGFLNIRTTGTNVLRASIINNGTLSCSTTNLPCWDSYYLNYYFITNNQTLIVNTSVTLAGRLFNRGTLRVPGNLGEVKLAFPFGSSMIVNRGTLLAETNSTLILTYSGEGIELHQETVINGAGIVRFAGVGGIASGPITVNGTAEDAGSNFYGNPYWNGPGVFRWLSGRLWDATFGTNLQVEMTGAGVKSIHGACTNLGNCTLLTNSLLAEGAFVNAGTIRVPANLGEVRLGFADYGGWFGNRGTLVVETNSTLLLSSNNWDQVQFQSGTVFEGAGLFRLVYSGFSCLGDITLNSTVELANDAGLHDQCTWNGTGLFRWLGGSLGGVTFGPDLHVEMSSPAPKYVSQNSGDACTNLGVVRWLTDAPFECFSSFNNLGQFILETNCTISDGFFHNAGILRVPADHGEVKLSRSGGGLINSGTLLVETNSTLVIYRPYAEHTLFQAGTVFDGAGVTRFLDGGLEITQEVTVNGTVELAGDSAIWGGTTWNGAGLFRWQRGYMADQTFGPNLRVEMSGPDEKIFNRTCTNLGTVRWLQDSPLRSYSAPDIASFLNGGLFLVEAAGAWTNDITFTNLASGMFRQTTGQFSMNTLHNSGNVELHGGLLNVVSNFVATPGSSCTIPLRGYSPGIDFGQLQASDLTLNGSLVVTLTDGFAPTNGSAFVLATNGVRHGQFASTSLPPLPPELLWRTGYQPTTVSLQVISSPTLSGAAASPDGSFQFTLTGCAGGSYEIQASTNLVDWVTLTNASFSGSAIFTDTSSTNFTHRFYRGALGD